MKVTRGYKTELDPTREQYLLFCRCAGTSRYAYNYLRHEVACVSVGTK